MNLFQVPLISSQVKLRTYFLRHAYNQHSFLTIFCGPAVTVFRNLFSSSIYS